jgi:glycerate kinase
MRIVIAPDSFKGSLTSVEVARALAAGWRRARPGDEVRLAPLADGGEGTLDAIEAAGGWVRRRNPTHDPLGRPIEAAWLQSARPGGERAVVELAASSGISRLTPAERNPYAATTFGTGELLIAALAAGARDVTLGIGGSATTDGGRGFIEALGGRVTGAARGDHDWSRLAVDVHELDRRLDGMRLHVACDVDNPLLGARGAAATYGPQKGASPEDVLVLDRRLVAWADALEHVTGRRERGTPGAGAAGGIGFALLSLAARFASFALEPGVDLVMAATGFAEALHGADLVITGEGRIDSQTAHGKTAFGVARRAREARVACVAVGGGVESEGVAALVRLGTVVVPVYERAVPVEDAIAAGAAPVEACGERIARRVSDAGIGGLTTIHA